MKHETLKQLLDIQQRQVLFNKILNNLRDFSDLKYIKYEIFDTSEGFIPAIIMTKYFDYSEVNDVKYVKVFLGCQHNEYNGLFGILNFLKLIRKQKINIDEILEKDQMLIFLPLMNPYGFLNPKKDNKSGYYLKNGTNLNRFWRRTFAPEYDDFSDDQTSYPIPEHTKLVKKLLQPFWENKDITIYFIDFHETSLLQKDLIDLSRNLNKESITYKFDHWLKECIISNVINVYKIPYYRKPLFTRCNSDANHTHINLSIKQLDTVYEKLLEYISNNVGKLPFYFCYSDKSKVYCQKLSEIVYNKLKGKLWNTNFPAFDHTSQNHGCIVKISDTTFRDKVHSMELESQKHFFNIFEEIEKSKTEPDYFEKKLNLINKSLELVLETIKEMIKLF